MKLQADPSGLYHPDRAAAKSAGLLGSQQRESKRGRACEFTAFAL